MAFALKAPNVVSTVAAPQVNIPESARSHAGAAALASGLFALKDIANIWRDHEDAVTQAGSMAELLDANGMPAEADAYRRAAKTFRPNFFKDPASASEARKNMLNDAINLLGKKYARDKDEKMMALRERELSATESYRESQSLAALARAESAVKDSETRLQNATTRAEQAEASARLAEDKAKHAEAVLQFQREKWDSQQKISQQNADANTLNAKTRAAIFEQKQSAIESAKELVDKYGLIPRSVGSTGNVVYVDPKTSKIKVRVTQNSDGTWTKSTSGLSDEDANDLLPKLDTVPESGTVNRLKPAQY